MRRDSRTSCQYNAHDSNAEKSARTTAYPKGELSARRYSRDGIQHVQHHALAVNYTPAWLPVVDRPAPRSGSAPTLTSD